MTLNEWLQLATKKLEQAKIGTARLDALVLLEDVTGKDRAWLLARPEHEISTDQVAELEKLLSRRARHEPLAYVRGKTEFYGREFVITPAVLEPRPESETMIDILIKLHHKASAGTPQVPTWRIADVGTGSGALGITTALELPLCEVELLDIDKAALEVAKSNVDKFTLNINVIKSDLLSSTQVPHDVLLCNLPYVPDNYQINTAATREPALAIFGGPDGLDVYRRLFDQVKKLENKPLYILCESLPAQHETMRAFGVAAGYQLTLADDFVQVLTPPS